MFGNFLHNSVAGDVPATLWRGEVARTAKLKRLSAAAVKAYFENPSVTKPLHDGGGLYLRKRDAGAYWSLRMTHPALPGREQWHSLFPDDPAHGYPHKTLADARAEAERLRAVRSKGLDPRAERERALREQRAADEAAREAERRRLTLRQLFSQWERVALAPQTRADGSRIGRKDGGAYVRQQFERRVFPVLGEVAAADVRKADLMTILDEAKAGGKVRTANVLLAQLKQMLRFAVAREVIDRNPLEAVSKRDVGGGEVERDRVLSDDELRALLRALPQAGMRERSVSALLLILATGARIGELMGAAWADASANAVQLRAVADASEVKLGFVDLTARRWHLPETKNGREHTIHVSLFALRQFRALAAQRGKDASGKLSPWVFPNAKGDGPVCVKSFGKQLADRQRPPEKRMRSRSKATESLKLAGGRWTAHDLRRTAATLMASLGVSGDVIDECLNHVIESRVRRTYIRNRRPEEQARAFDVLGERLDAFMAEVTDRPAPMLRRVA